MNIEVRELEGRPHFVVPTVMITAGVFRGSQGPVAYTPEVLRQSVPFWDGKPVVVYHPDMYNHSLAGSPAVFNRQKVGTVFNTRFDGHRLLTESWIDSHRVRLVDHRVADAILNRRMMEVSTGLHIDFRPASVTNDPHAVKVAGRLHPDHLAILPGMVGACSIRDGAGLVRNDLLTQYAHSPCR